MAGTGDTEGRLCEAKKKRKGRPGRGGSVTNGRNRSTVSRTSSSRQVLGHREKRKKNQAVNATQRPRMLAGSSVEEESETRSDIAKSNKQIEQRAGWHPRS